MIDKNVRVAVLMGGMSSERPISLTSGAAVLGALQARGWDAVGIDVGADLAAQLVSAQVGAAFIALHGRYGEDGCVQGLLEVLGIPYTGSGVRASAMAMDKAVTKRMVADLPGVVLARDTLVHAGSTMPDLGGPMILKPIDGGSTIGTVIVREAAAWADALALAVAEGPSVLAEELIEGGEITVAVVDGVPLPVVQIVPDSGFFDFEAKYQKGRTRYVCPAELPASTTLAAQAAAAAVYARLGCRGLARADFMVRSDGVPVFLEINTIPGMTATSLSPMAAAATGVSFEALVEKILMGASRDHAR